MKSLPYPYEEHDRRRLDIAGVKGCLVLERIEEQGHPTTSAYCIGHGATQSFLSFRLIDKKTGYHMVFPNDELDNVNAAIQVLLHALDTLSELGVTFRTNNRHWDKQQCDWVKPTKE